MYTSARDINATVSDNFRFVSFNLLMSPKDKSCYFKELLITYQVMTAHVHDIVFRSS